MSSSIDIPRRKQPVRGSLSSVASPTSTSTPNSSPAMSSYQSSPSSYGTPSLRRFGKSKAQDETAQETRTSWDRRPSLLGSSLSKSEYTVIDLAHSDGPPRLACSSVCPIWEKRLQYQVSCVKSSQGFDWNQELFLPSYMDFDSSDLERRPDPVHDIVLTDEEAAALLP